MKINLLFFIFLALIFLFQDKSLKAAENMVPDLLSAEKKYQEGNFFSAAQILKSVEKNKKYSVEIYRNLTLSLIRENQLAEATLYCTRGLLLYPQEKSLLKFYDFLREKMMLNDTMDIRPLLDSSLRLFEIYIWLSFILFVFSLGGYGIYFFSSIKSKTFLGFRHPALITASSLFILASLCLWQSRGNYQNLAEFDLAVVMPKDSSLLSKPDLNQDGPKLEQGAIVKIISTHGLWYSIETAKKSSGFIRTRDLKKISPF